MNLATSINDWLFAVATVSVPVLMFVVTMYLLLKIHFMNEAIMKIEAVHLQQRRDIVEIVKAVAALDARIASAVRNLPHG